MYPLVSTSRGRLLIRERLQFNVGVLYWKKKKKEKKKNFCAVYRFSSESQLNYAPARRGVKQESHAAGWSTNGTILCCTQWSGDNGNNDQRREITSEIHALGYKPHNAIPRKSHAPRQPSSRSVSLFITRLCFFGVRLIESPSVNRCWLRRRVAAWKSDGGRASAWNTLHADINNKCMKSHHQYINRYFLFFFCKLYL